MPKFLPKSGFKWTDPKEFDVTQHTSKNSKECVLEVDLDYLKELQELCKDRFSPNHRFF